MPIKWMSWQFSSHDERFYVCVCVCVYVRACDIYVYAAALFPFFLLLF